MNIRFYVSDHGYGHAVRAARVIAALPAGATITVVSGATQLDLLRQLVAPRSIYGEPLRVPELGVPLAGGVPIYGTPLATQIEDWLRALAHAIDPECASLVRAEPDLIFTDVTPLACLVGDRLGKPVVAISNFTWYDQYLGRVDGQCIEPLRAAYRAMRCLLSYPLAMPMAWLEPVPRIALATLGRAADPRRVRQIRDQSTGLRVTVAFGGVYVPPAIDLRALGGDTTIFMAGEVAVATAGTVKYLSRKGELQHFIAASDVVVTKAGWGIVSEALASRTPLLLVARDINEDIAIAEAVERVNGGQRVSWAKISDITPDWLKKFIASCDRSPLRLPGSALPQALESAARICGVSY